jgi:hypothetical protein
VVGVLGRLPLVRVVDGLKTNVLLVLKGAIELWVLPVEGQLGPQVVDVFVDELAIACQPLALPIAHPPQARKYLERLRQRALLSAEIPASLCSPEPP